MVPAYNPRRRYACYHLVGVGYINGNLRVPASRIVLAASSTAALHRLTEVLLGKRHIEPSPRRHNPVPTYSYDMETKNAKEKQDLFDRGLCPWCFVRDRASYLLQAFTKLVESICVASILRITYLWLIVFTNISGDVHVRFLDYLVTVL